MQITYISSTGLLQCSGSDLGDILTGIGAFGTVTLSGTKTCNIPPFTNTYPVSDITNVNNNFYVQAGAVYVSPKFFGLPALVDAVYYLSLKFIKTGGGYTMIQNCAFIDLIYKCKLATMLDQIIEENKAPNQIEKISTTAHLMHYALINGSNCGCNCTEMCSVFEELTILLKGIDPNFTDCGCN